MNVNEADIIAAICAGVKIIGFPHPKKHMIPYVADDDKMINPYNFICCSRQLM